MTARTSPETFWPRVNRGGPEDCWEWQGSTRSDGYGRINNCGRRDGVHRVAYQYEVGPIPEGLVIDHLCRNRACCNPAHLEPVTPGENARRGVLGQHMKEKAARQTHCRHGHEYTPENTYRNPSSGRRQCRTCHTAYMREYLPEYRKTYVRPRRCKK